MRGIPASLPGLTLCSLQSSPPKLVSILMQSSLLQPQWASCWVECVSPFSCCRSSALSIPSAWNVLPECPPDSWTHFFQVFAQRSSYQRGHLWTPHKWVVPPLIITLSCLCGYISHHSIYHIPPPLIKYPLVYLSIVCLPPLKWAQAFICFAQCQFMKLYLM